MNAPDQGCLTAFHEAGHAVAVILRCGTITAIAIDPESGETHYGATDHDGPTWANPFIAYAGPWAEARVQWPDIDLTDTDGGGRTFRDYVQAAFENSADAQTYEAYRRHEDAWSQGPPPTFVEKTRTWNAELEEHWPVIRAVALRLLAGDVLTHDVVRDIVGDEI
jgi:hypothetical protein